MRTNKVVNISLCIIISMIMSLLVASVAHAFYLDPGKWVPSSGTSIVTADSYGQRYIRQTMYWNGVSRLQGFAVDDRTYEHETVFNNYDGKSYAGGYDGYWASNLPSAYLDTQFADGSSELNYTVGSAYARGIQAYTTFYYRIDIKNGNSTSDTAKVQGQLGERNPDWCYSTWCIYALQTEKLIPAWEQTIPGTKSWTHY